MIISITSQILILIFSGDQLNWYDYRIIILSFTAIFSTIYFIYTEIFTNAAPIIPISIFKGHFAIIHIFINFFIGLSSYAFIFTIPLLFQIILGDPPSNAGLRLVVPSLATPIGGLIAGVAMSRYHCLRSLIYIGIGLMTIGNLLGLLINPSTNAILLMFFLIPANIGQGIVYPSCLFTFIHAFEGAFQATSTSTVYLLRSIGGVWGISGFSSVVQRIVRSKVTKHLKLLECLKDWEIEKIVADVTKTSDKIITLPQYIRQVVLQDYKTAIMFSQIFSIVSCLLALLMCCLYDMLNSKPKIVV